MRFDVLYHEHVSAQHVLSRARRVTVTVHSGIHTVLGGQREAYIGTGQSLESDLSPHRPFLGVYVGMGSPLRMRVRREALRM